MNNLHFLLKKNDIDSFSIRELALILNTDRKRIWQIMRRLQRYGIVRIETKKSVTYWSVIDKDNFLNEIQRCTE